MQCEQAAKQENISLQFTKASEDIFGKTKLIQV
jgi:hypothetical protein